MNFNDFLHFNNKCPVCENDLTLYVFYADDQIWQAERINDNEHKFKIFSFDNSTARLMKEYSEDYFILGKTPFFSSDIIQNNFVTHNLHFFFLCKSEGFKGDKYYWDINPYYGCYYRSAPPVKLQLDPENKNWKIEAVNEKSADLVNLSEVFSFKVMTDNQTEKHYLLNLDYEDKVTRFFYYAVTEEQQEMPNFEPQTFDKEMALLPTRPQFELSKRDHLISKFNSWIMLS